MTNKSYYLVDEVAEILNVTPRTVRNLIARGRFPNAYRIDPSNNRSHHRIPVSDLEKFLEKQKKASA